MEVSMSRKLALTITLLGLLGSLGCSAAATGPLSLQSFPNFTPPTSSGTKQWTSPPSMMIDPNKEYTAVIDTNYGKITVKLYAKLAPMTVNNFVFLALEKFYNDIKFHRIVKGFVIQTGDPRGNGTGDPGYRFKDELPGANLNYRTGTLAMANSGANTNGSQFFICLTDLSGRLPKNYSIFGEVTDGMDVVQKIGNLPVTSSISGENSKPTLDVFMKGVEVRGV